VKNLVLTGIAGAEFGTRGFIDAYDVDTGKRVWRFYTIPGEGEPGSDTWSGDSWARGGGSTWITGTYDPELNLVYWGTGNPGPDMDGDVRRGDNLYSCSIVALDADTGKLKWHYQFTPHDVHDWDAISDPVLVDVSVRGRSVKAVVQANRNGFFYALDRSNGKLLAAKPYTKVTWADGIGNDGRPVLIPGREPTEEGNLACPGLGGGHNWQATAFSQLTGLYYFSSRVRRRSTAPAPSSPWIRPTAKRSGASTWSRRRRPEFWRQRADWCSPAIRRATQSRSMRGPVRSCGSSRPADRSSRRRSRIRWTGRSTSRWPPAARWSRSRCRRGALG